MLSQEEWTMIVEQRRDETDYVVNSENLFNDCTLKKKQFSEFTEGQNSLSQFCRAFGKKKSFSDGQI